MSGPAAPGRDGLQMGLLAFFIPERFGVFFRAARARTAVWEAPRMDAMPYHRTKIDTQVAFESVASNGVSPERA